MNWKEILIMVWCLASPGIASLWGYKAGYRARDVAEQRRQVIRNLYTRPRKTKNDY